MAFLRCDYLGGQPFDEVATTPQHPIGFIARAQDPDNGNTQTEFVYVQGVAGGGVGALVTINKRTGTTALATSRSKGPVGVLHGALTAGTFGWAAMSGSCRAQVTGTVAAGQQAYVSATAGKLTATVVLGDFVSGMAFASADGVGGAGFAIVTLADPALTDSDNA